jgi:hypothetical protein
MDGKADGEVIAKKASESLRDAPDFFPSLNEELS